MKRRRQERYSAVLAAVPLEQHAEAERLFTKHVELSTIAVVTEEERIGHIVKASEGDEKLREALAGPFANALDETQRASL